MLKHEERRFFQRQWTFITSIVAAIHVCFGTAAANADVISVGTETVGSGQTVPFFGGWEFQQVYSSSLFSTSFRIDELRFFRRSAAGGGIIGSEIDRTTYTIGLSVTDRTPGVASANPLSTTLADNITGPETVFFSGLKGGSGDSLGLNDDVFFAGANSFTYDPTLGNLLVTVSKASDPTGGSFAGDLRAAFDNGTTDSTLFSFVASTTAGATVANVSSPGQGLLTQFDGMALANTSSAPEPSSSGFLLVGSIIALSSWRRRAAAAFTSPDQRG